MNIELVGNIFQPQGNHTGEALFEKLRLYFCDFLSDFANGRLAQLKRFNEVNGALQLVAHIRLCFLIGVFVAQKPAVIGINSQCRRCFIKNVCFDFF